MKHHRSKEIVGIDLGDLKHVASVLDRGSRGGLRNQRLRIIAKVCGGCPPNFPAALIALEVGTHSPWITRFLQDLGHEVLVANPRKLRAIYQNDRKCDFRKGGLRLMELLWSHCEQQDDGALHASRYRADLQMAQPSKSA